jgi:hypothetical protein
MTHTQIRRTWTGVAIICIAGILLGLLWDQHLDTLINALLL